MADNLLLDRFVAGQTLLDVGGETTTGLDTFVAGMLYEAMESSGPPPPSFVGEAGSELACTTVKTLLDNAFEAGSELQVTTVRVVDAFGTYSVGVELDHVVMVAGHTSTITLGAGAEIVVTTVKFVPSDVVPGAMMLLGVG